MEERKEETLDQPQAEERQPPMRWAVPPSRGTVVAPRRDSHDNQANRVGFHGDVNRVPKARCWRTAARVPPDTLASSVHQSCGSHLAETYWTTALDLSLIHI